MMDAHEDLTATLGAHDHDEGHDDHSAVLDRLREDSDADTASARSISLSSPPHSNRASTAFEPSHTMSTIVGHGSPPHSASSHRYTIDTDFSSEADDHSLYAHDLGTRASSVTSVSPSEPDEPKRSAGLPTYPPAPLHDTGDTASVTSFTSTSSRKARPESMLLQPPDGPIVLGIALVDFNHMVGPRIEFSKGEIFEDEEVAKILPFLALPDGAHLSTEDYSYFHIVPPATKPTTVFGISCNRQIAATELLVKDADVTRSTVQKAVVVLASKPVFGPIRDRLGVVTRALFNQKDFRETGILVDFAASLEISLRSQLTESGLYMGTSLRELVHTFRQRTLILVKALILQRKIMFYGHPVERLCTYQYSLISLMPGLLQTLDDCGSPPLASRAPTLSRPTSLKTSDHRSMMAYLGLPLDVFGKDAFFQPYLPLQQLDMIQGTRGWLCGSTNSIVTQRKEIDILVNTELGTVEYRDPKVERLIGLTAADRKWMDDVVRDVNEGWNDADPTRPIGMQFKGSDDYLRSKFEEYISAALASVKFRDFMAKGEGGGVLIKDGSGGDANSAIDFNPLWIQEFKQTNAYEVWDRVTDPLLFDIVEPRHPCNEKPSVVGDIGLRLQEGIQDLKLEQQLAPARETLNRTWTTGSTNFLKAVEGVRGRWAQRSASSTSVNETASIETTSSTPVEVSKSDIESPASTTSKEVPLPPPPPARRESDTSLLSSPVIARPLSETAGQAKAALSSWGAGVGSFFSSRASRLSLPKVATPPEGVPRDITPSPHEVTPPSKDIAVSSPPKDGSSLAPLDLDHTQPREPADGKSPLTAVPKTARPTPPLPKEGIDEEHVDMQGAKTPRTPPEQVHEPAAIAL